MCSVLSVHFIRPKIVQPVCKRSISLIAVLPGLVSPKWLPQQDSLCCLDLYLQSGCRSKIFSWSVARISISPVRVTASCSVSFILCLMCHDAQRFISDWLTGVGSLDVCQLHVCVCVWVAGLLTCCSLFGQHTEYGWPYWVPAGRGHQQRGTTRVHRISCICLPVWRYRKCGLGLGWE